MPSLVPILGMLCGGTISAIVVATGYVLKELELSLCFPPFFAYSTCLGPLCGATECSGPCYYNDPIAGQYSTALEERAEQDTCPLRNPAQAGKSNRTNLAY